LNNSVWAQESPSPGAVRKAITSTIPCRRPHWKISWQQADWLRGALTVVDRNTRFQLNSENGFW